MTAAAPQSAGTALTTQQKLTVRLASKLYELLELPPENSGELIDSMVSSLFATKAEVSDAQVQSFLIVAAAHRLNPWLREIYAFPKDGGITPIVGIDGWVRIITSHPQYDGHEFLYNGEDKPPADPKLITSVTCLLYRKDRTRPTQVTEFMAECKGTSSAWTKTPARFLRHRALMQAGRYAFGLGGIHAEDDEHTTLPGSAGPVTATDPETGEITELMPSAKKADVPPPARAKPDVVDVQATTRTEPAGEPPPPPPPPPHPSDEPAQGTIDGVAAGTTMTGPQLATDEQKAQLGKRATAVGSTLDACLKAKGFKLDGLTLVEAGVLKTFMMSGQAPKAT